MAEAGPPKEVALPSRDGRCQCRARGKGRKGDLTSQNQDLEPEAGHVLSSPEESETVTVLVIKCEQAPVQNCTKAPVGQNTAYILQYSRPSVI